MPPTDIESGITWREISTKELQRKIGGPIEGVWYFLGILRKLGYAKRVGFSNTQRGRGRPLTIWSIPERIVLELHTPQPSPSP